MLINVKGKHFHVQNDLGDILVTAEIAAEIKPEPQQPRRGKMVWRVAELILSGRIVIQGSCDACRQGVTFDGKNPKELFHFHCGFRDTPPKEIIDQHFAARKRKPEILDASEMLRRQVFEAAARRVNDRGSFEYVESDPE